MSVVCRLPEGYSRRNVPAVRGMTDARDALQGQGTACHNKRVTYFVAYFVTYFTLGAL